MINQDLEKKMGEATSYVRKSGIVISILIAGVLLLIMMFSHSAMRRQADATAINQMSDLACILELTDLCLFTEARYTRHPSQADIYSAFQDHPVALEHFPAGSI
ncbi:MAG: hypothetical protein ABFD50_10850, partial [Smithella sp.]